jgi:hypothetical protein
MGQNLAFTIQGIGGIHTSLNIAAATVVKNAAGTLFGLMIENVGVAGVLTLSDLATTTGAAAGNQILTLTTAQLTSILAASGPYIDFAWPCAAGIAVTTISGGIVVAASYT